MRRLSVSLLAFCLTASLAQATRYHVATNGNDAASGLDWATALRTPGAALALAQDNDTVMLNDGQFTNAYNLPLDKAVTLTSTNGAAFTTLNANGSDTLTTRRQVILMTAPGAVVEYLTIRGGYTNTTAGGVYMTAGTLRHCIVSNNYAFNYGANVWMGNGLVSNCVLTAGTAGYNGGCGVTLTNGLVVDCLIYKNTAGRAGGGVYQSGGIVRNCVIRDNTASSWSGGGACLLGGTMENCLITGNTGGSYPAGTGGGGLYQTGGTLQFCTLADNASIVRGGGLYASAGKILNCIVYRNLLLDSGKPESLVVTGTAVASNSCAPELTAGSGNISLSPEWQDSGSRPYDLRPGSPCLDSAQVIDSVTQDLVKETRPLDGNGDSTAAPDMGCYEMNPAGAFRGNLISSVLLADYEATPTITAYACGSAASGLYYRWDPDGDGDIDAEGGAEVQSISRTYAPGLYTLNLSISNGAGEVVVVNRPGYIRVRGANTFVSTNGPHLNPYATWETASTNIQQAVDMTAPGGAIVISNGVYKLSAPIALAYPLTLTGVTNPALPVLDRATTGTRLIGITDSGVTVENLDVRNGSAPTAADTGGGIYMTGGLVRNCVFTNNTAVFGGGVYMTAGMVSNCLFIRNPTKAGGGGSGRGGAVYMNGGTLADSRILNNTSVRAGAGVLINGGDMKRCFIYGNNAGHGGGGVSMEGAATIENCLIVSNMSGYYSGGGGGVLMLAAGRIVHCTVVSNRTTTVGLGGGIYRGSSWNGVVTNTIIWRNSTDSGVSNNVCTANPTNFFRYCSFPELPPDLGISGNITNEPVFGPALTLAAGSPGIDAGLTLPTVTLDLTGGLRPRDGDHDRQAISDMGAYEFWDTRPRGSLLIIR